MGDNCEHGNDVRYGCKHCDDAGTEPPLARGRMTDLPDAETAWTEFRREHYIAPNIDGPALESAFIQGHRTAVAALTTRAKHLADEWEPHPDGDIQMFVAQLFGSKDE